MVGAHVSRLQRNLGHRCGFALVLDRLCGLLAGADFREAMARGEALHDGLIERQANRRLRRGAARRREKKEHEKERVFHANLICAALPDVTRAMKTSSSDVGTCRMLSGS